MADTSWIGVSPGGLWEVQRRWMEKRKCGENTPLLGSVCKIRVSTKHLEENQLPSLNDTVAPVTAVDDDDAAAADDADGVHIPEFTRSPDSVLQVPVDSWVLLRMGEGQCDIVEGCLEGMRAGETCEITVKVYQRECKPTVNVSPASKSEQMKENRQSHCFFLHLHSFTPGQESWQMSPAEKWEWVLSHKQRGSQRFGKGDIWGAAHCYCCAMKLVITLQRHMKCKDSKLKEKDDHCCQIMDTDLATEDDKYPDIPSEMDYRNVKAELHSNLSLCQLRLEQPSKAKDSSSKAIALNPANFKAWYRLGQSCLQLEDFEEARQAFGKVLELQPDSTSALKALKQVKIKEKEFGSKLGGRLSKMFT